MYIRSRALYSGVITGQSIPAIKSSTVHVMNSRLSGQCVYTIYLPFSIEFLYIVQWCRYNNLKAPTKIASLRNHFFLSKYTLKGTLCLNV